MGRCRKSRDGNKCSNVALNDFYYFALALKDFSCTIERIHQKDEDLLPIDDDDRNTANFKTTHHFKVIKLIPLIEGYWNEQLKLFC